MKAIRQLVRQPMKFLSGVVTVSLAVCVLCVCLGQSIAAGKAAAALERRFTTVALQTIKYNYEEIVAIDSEGYTIHGLRYHDTIPQEIADWIERTVQTRPDLVESISSPGLASACISELTSDNITAHRYYYPLTGRREEMDTREQQATSTYAAAMLEMVLDQVEAPLTVTFQGTMEDGTEVSVARYTTVELKGTVKSVVSLEEGYDDPTGRTIYVSLTVPDQEALDALNLDPGERYLVYGPDYLDGNWALCGMISDSLSARLGRNVCLEALDDSDFFDYSEMEIKALKELSPYTEYCSRYVYDGVFVDVSGFEMKYRDAVFLTAQDNSTLGDYELVSYPGGSYPKLCWDRWITGDDGSLTQVSQEEYSRRYFVPTIAHLDGTAEEFLRSDSGKRWADTLRRMDVNHHAFPVIGVDQLGYIPDFARQTARIVDGRDFTREELESGKRVCILAESLAASNGLHVGDFFSPQFYNYDWDDPNQDYISDGKGVSNPSAYTYTANTEFVGTGEQYEIVGTYRQDNAWADTADNPYSFTPNTIFVPKASVPSDMDYGEQGFFRTLILKNGMVEPFLNFAVEAGYGDLFVYYDQGYTQVAENLHSFEEAGKWALAVGVIVYGAILGLMLFLFPGGQGKALSVMNAMGVERRKRMGHVVSTGAGIFIPGTVLGTAAGILLWQRVIRFLADSTGSEITLEMDVPMLLIVALFQLAAALLLAALMAVPMTRETGIGKRK